MDNNRLKNKNVRNLIDICKGNGFKSFSTYPDIVIDCSRASFAMKRVYLTLAYANFRGTDSPLSLRLSPLRFRYQSCFTVVIVRALMIIIISGVARFDNVSTNNNHNNNSSDGNSN